MAGVRLKWEHEDSVRKQSQDSSVPPVTMLPPPSLFVYLPPHLPHCNPLLSHTLLAKACGEENSAFSLQIFFLPWFLKLWDETEDGGAEGWRDVEKKRDASCLLLWTMT